MIDHKAIFEKIRMLEIKTKHLTKEVLSGEYHAAFKGRGMAFSEVRNYQRGDEIRTIDWNVTARFNEPYVKVFEEERELSVFLLVDISSSMNFGANEKSKRDLALELSAVLSFSAISNNDKVGGVFFSNELEKFIPPGKGRKHALSILSELIYHENKSTKTDLNAALKFVQHVAKKRSVVFVISDFIHTDNISDALSRLKRKHDVIALKIRDEAELKLPKLGFLPLKNLETGKWNWVNTRSKSTKELFKAQYERQDAAFFQDLKKRGIDGISIHTTDDFYPSLVELFHKRMR